MLIKDATENTKSRLQFDKSCNHIKPPLGAQKHYEIAPLVITMIPIDPYLEMIFHAPLQLISLLLKYRNSSRYRNLLRHPWWLSW